MIKYLGSKRLLVPHITAAIAALPAVRTAVDLFSGTARVGHALKAQGLRVLANDHLAYAEVLARCYVEADRDVAAEATALLDELAALPPAPGWFTRTYCCDSRYLQPHNGARIEAIRAAIAQRCLPRALEAVALTALLEAADRVDSTTGVQMAFLKQWAARSHRDLQLRLPALLPRAAAGEGAAFGLDALVAAAQLDGDVLYLDPPYNQHKYLGNYHVWETLVRWDAPEVYGIARKRADCRTRRSPFNSRVHAEAALTQVLTASPARQVVLSFSDEGWLGPAAIAAMLQPRGYVRVLGLDYRRYVGAQIGIHNPRGEKVGTVSHLRNREFLFVVTPHRAALRRLSALGFGQLDAVLAAGA